MANVVLQHFMQTFRAPADRCALSRDVKKCYVERIFMRPLFDMYAFCVSVVIMPDRICLQYLRT